MDAVGRMPEYSLGFRSHLSRRKTDGVQKHFALAMFDETVRNAERADKRQKSRPALFK